MPVETIPSSDLRLASKSKMAEYYPGFDRIISDFIEYDNVDAFVPWIHYKARSVGGYNVYQSLMLAPIIHDITLETAVKCATALLQGETGLKLDINANTAIGCTPLHRSLHSPELIDLFLRHGARTDIRYDGQLPLNYVLQRLSKRTHFLGWSTAESLYMMIVFCQCETKWLEGVRLLFRATNEAEKEIYRYVKDGKLIEVAALLTVAREEVTSPSFFKGLCDPALNGSMSLRQLVLSEIVSLMASQITLVSTSEEVHDELNNKLETMMSMLRLVEIFERVGDKIELYRRYLTKLSQKELATQMACLFINEGFAEYKYFDLKSVSTTQFHEDFLESLESKLSGENEGTQLESGTTKIYKHDADAMWIPRLSNQPLNLEAIPILNNEDDAKGSLPLKVSLEKLCYHPYLNDWTPKKSIFKLVVILCLPQLKESLESIRLVACKTEIETIGCDLVRHGKLIELASLLMVAPEKLNVTTSPRSNDLRSNAIRRCIMSGLQELLDAEVRLMGRSNSHKLVEKCVSHPHVSYSDEGTRSRLEIAGEIQNLLEKAGFAMKPKDTDLNDMKCFSLTMEPADRTILPLALRPRDFSVLEKEQHWSGTQPSVQSSAAGLRPFHTMVQQGNWSSRVSAPKSKALMKPGIPKSMGWFLSLGVDITKLIKRV
ncbi:hypothetical protein V6N12_025824 [Hibiscus sabdariffa]|uniref:Uncharacterized protein n=1 Tax=Hibiscus sabdariffa TaxID=183260 RepID=A0ABR2DQX9_9ROSI